MLPVKKFGKLQSFCIHKSFYLKLIILVTGGAIKTFSLGYHSILGVQAGISNRSRRSLHKAFIPKEQLFMNTQSKMNGLMSSELVYHLPSSLDRGMGYPSIT